MILSLSRSLLFGFEQAAEKSPEQVVTLSMEI